MAENAFCDDVYLSKAQKDALFTEWQRFVKSGFHPLFLTQRLYQHLVECGVEVHGRERLWQTFFNGEAVQFRRLLEMFAGDRRSLASGDHAWLQGPGWDLSLAMCDLMTPLYPPLLYLLDELERYHNELPAAWHEFATLSGVAAVSPPASYRLEANTRSLMQLAIQAALAQKQPLIGLQLQLPQAVTYDSERLARRLAWDVAQAQSLAEAERHAYWQRVRAQVEALNAPSLPHRSGRVWLRAGLLVGSLALLRMLPLRHLRRFS